MKWSDILKMPDARPKYPSYIVYTADNAFHYRCHLRKDLWRAIGRLMDKGYTRLEIFVKEFDA